MQRRRRELENHPENENILAVKASAKNCAPEYP